MKKRRVGAILSSNSKSVKFLGYGVYVGDFVPDENAGGMADFCRVMKRANPKIELDNGDVVWGCECWWDSEDEIKKTLNRYTEHGIPTEVVSVESFRKVNTTE